MSRSLLTCILFSFLYFTVPCLANNSDYFKPPLQYTYYLNPEGSVLAINYLKDDIEHVKIQTINNNLEQEIFTAKKLGPENSYISGLSWIDNNSLLITLIERKKGITNLKDTRFTYKNYIIDIDKSANKKPVVKKLITSGNVISTLPGDENLILHARNGRHSAVYKIDTQKLSRNGEKRTKTQAIDGGQFSKSNKVASVSGYSFSWFADKTGLINAVMWQDEKQIVRLQTRKSNGDEWLTLKEWDFSKKAKDARTKQWLKDNPEKIASEYEEDIGFYLPAGRVGDRFIIVIDKDRDTHGVYYYDYANAEKELLFESESGDIVEVQQSHNGNTLLSVGYFENGNIKHHYFQSEFQQIQTRLDKDYPGSSSYIVGMDGEGKRFLILISSATNPGRYILFTQSKNSFKDLKNLTPWLKGKKLIQPEIGVIDNDGVTIDYFLTLPDTKTPPALVVMPHGGPYGVRDSYNYDGLVQFLASKNLAVLQINHRGSGGYGKIFESSGKGQFGEKILEDIEAVVSHIINSGRIDSRKICSTGASYGGYASIMLAIRSPKLYQCVTSFAGVTDVGLLFTGASATYTSTQQFLEEWIGDPKKEQQHMQSISPVYQIDKLQAPIYFAHGTKDKRVDIEHAYRLEYTLKKANKHYIKTIFPEEGHGFENSETAAQYYKKVADFILENTRDTPE